MKLSNELLLEIKQNKIISKDKVFDILKKFYLSMNRAYSYRVLSMLVKENHLYKLDSNTYTTIEKRIFNYELANKKLPKYVGVYGEFVIWDSNILNKWLNHLLNAVITFVEVDRSMMGLVYEELKARGYNHILLNPNLNEFNKYFDSKLIIIRPLAKTFIEPEHKISIERLIIQIYSDKILLSLYGNGEMNDMLNEIFKTYYVNLDKLYHYARRKKIYNELHDYLVNNINSNYLYHD